MSETLRITLHARHIPNEYRSMMWEALPRPRCYLVTGNGRDLENLKNDERISWQRVE